MIGGRQGGLEAALLERDDADVDASGWALMNVSAACFAAARRLGATSVAAMLPETSMARMTVPEAWDTGTDAAGPAMAIASTATPAMVNHTPPGRARPRPGPPP